MKKILNIYHNLNGQQSLKVDMLFVKCGKMKKEN